MKKDTEVQAMAVVYTQAMDIFLAEFDESDAPAVGLKVVKNLKDNSSDVCVNFPEYSEEVIPITREDNDTPEMIAKKIRLAYLDVSKRKKAETFDFVESGSVDNINDLEQKVKLLICMRDISAALKRMSAIISGEE